ncbi:MAG: peptidoglycan-binding protein [Chloroflexota bacterium]
MAMATMFIVSACSVLASSEPLAVVPEPPPREFPAVVAPREPEVNLQLVAETPDAEPIESVGSVPAVTVARYKPRPKPGPFSINLYKQGDFMHQQTKDWCVAGSTQIMMNIIDTGKPNRSVAFQKKLYFEGRRLSRNQKKLGSIGVDLTGWMELLNTRGYGPYEVDGGNTRAGAIRKAARALRQTGKPVGLATWRGAHSWVMSGFTATADPAYTKDFKVLKVYIQDTWYPFVSTIWGASRPPNAAVPVAALAEDFLPYRRPTARYPKRDGKFMLILPVLPPNTVVR